MKKEEQDEALRTTGNLLKERRESIGMSRSTLAMKVGTTYESIRFYEEGRRAMRLDRLFALMSALGIPTNGLLSRMKEDLRKTARLATRISALSADEYRSLIQKIEALLEEG